MRVDVALGISKMSILDGSSDMPVNGQVVIEFDSELSDACPVSENVSLMANATNVPINLTYFSNNRSILVIKATDSFVADTAYTLDIGSLCDYANNAHAGTQIGFTTISSDAADNTTPALTSITPANSATDVDVTTAITILVSEVFDKRMIP